jgi:lysozyme
MRHGADALALIKYYEGFRARPYLCPANVWTLGFGSTRDLFGKPVTSTTPPVTQEQGELLLEWEVSKIDTSLQRFVSVELDQCQWDALVDFCYNLGMGAFQRSTLRQVVNRGEHEDVPDEFRKWVWGGGRKLKGLVERREKETEVYVAGME